MPDRKRVGLTHTVVVPDMKGLMGWRRKASCCGLQEESASLPAAAQGGSRDEDERRDMRPLETFRRDEWFTHGTELRLPEQLR